MSNKLKRRISALLSFVMLFSVMFSGTSVTAFAAGAQVDVWDFGAVAESDTTLYNNRITVDLINGLTNLGTDGKFIADGDVEFNGLTVNVKANDRMYCYDANCTKNYGTNGKAETAYEDGYTAAGMWYANGTGGDNRRYAQIDTISAGDEVVVYTGASNSADLSVHFTYLGTDGTQDDVASVASGTMAKLSFVADYSGSYKIWYDTSVSGKPVINRIVRYPATTVTGTVSNLADVTTSGCTVSLKNDTTGDTFETSITAGENTFTVDVTPGYTYSATLKGVVGYGFTFASKTIEVPLSAITAGGTSATLEVEPKETYDVTGNLVGFAASYDVSKLELTLVPDSDDVDTVNAVIEGTSYSATLEPDITYTAVLGGVNDYEITSGGALLYSNVKNVTHDIEVSTKPVYNVSGDISVSDGGDITSANVSALIFTNLEDGYTYEANLTTGAYPNYSVQLRDGEYQAAISSTDYKTSTHVSVKGGNVVKDLYFKATAVAAPDVDTSVRDIYVGVEGQVNNFETLGEAVKAAAVMNPQSEADRVTIHIAPGTYREQVSIDVPYVTLVKEGVGDVVLTWYYGIGYKYYSVGDTGYWDDEADFDKYEKNGPQKWGVGTYVKSTATGFKAEGITFESSFNKYVTDEEIVDGVESDGSIAFNRTLGANVTSRAATERSTALCVEADMAEFKDCTFIGSQDTLYMGAPVRAYYKNCVIEGNTDYIFGSGNAIFDACELRFAGYSDTANGGYITAARQDADKWNGFEVAYKGYLFRGCTITRLDKDAAGQDMLHASGYFGRPWDQNASVFFFNTVLEDADAITAAGWTDMSGNLPQNANYNEYNTTYNGVAVDTTGRVTGTGATGAPAVSEYYGSWTPSFANFTEDAAVAFETVPYFSSDVDVLLPASGDTLTVKYSLGADDANDASRIDWYRVAEDGTETIIKTSSVAAGGEVYTLQAADEGYYVKAVVTPVTLAGAQAEAQSTVTVKTVDKGNGGSDVPVTPRPNGKVAVFLAGDSTVKDYSAGAINNSGAARDEGSWGEFLEYFLDSDYYTVRNYAQGGRSSRTFIDGTKDDGSDRYLDMIKDEMMAGDYLFIQFGHNDSSASYADRYVPVGEPDENGIFPYTAPSAEGAGDGSFKWYLQEMVDAAKEAGATPVMVTPVSRMYFNDDGTIYSHHGNNDEYVTATKQVAEENGIQCIDLYAYTKDLYEQAWAVNGDISLPTALFAAGEKTHHSKVGGFIIAAEMAYQLKTNAQIGLGNAIVTPTSISSVNSKDEVEFRVWADGIFEAYAVNADGAYDTSLVDSYWSTYGNEQIETINNTEPAEPDVPDPTPTADWGDVDKSGILTANDAAAILQYVLNAAFSGVEKYDFTYADVTADGDITAADASSVLQKTLNADFEFPAA